MPMARAAATPACALDELVKIGTRLTTVPAGFNVHKTVKRFMDNRLAAIESGEGIDWATGEALAFGTLLDEGHPVRLSGQDSERGTFTQRHSVLNDQETDETYTPLNNIAPDQQRYEVINSMLSEEAVLGFEYGYSLAEPKTLTLWEAQFGDFANGAQVVIDQFICSGERKWFRMSGLVMLLPHGYEGQGPEHSSARLERYLQLCAEDNMQVCNCTTPANYFHVAAPAGEARFPQAADPDDAQVAAPPQAGDVDAGRDRAGELLPSPAVGRRRGAGPQEDDDQARARRADPPRRAVLGQGLLRPARGSREARHQRRLSAAARTALSVPGQGAARRAQPLQERRDRLVPGRAQEHGRLGFVQPYVDWVLEQMGRTNDRPRYVGRPASASTATGLMRTHLAQLQPFLEEAFAK